MGQSCSLLPIHTEEMPGRNKVGHAALDTLKGLASKQRILEIHRMKHYLSKGEAEELWHKYLEYMVIKARYMDSASQMKFSTSPEVDDLWHTHLLNTVLSGTHEFGEGHQSTCLIHSPF